MFLTIGMISTQKEECGMGSTKENCLSVVITLFLRSAIFCIGTLMMAGCATTGPAVQTSPASKIETTKSIDGVEIRYEVHGNGSPTLIFVHGWSCNRSFWKHQGNHFSRTNRVVALDLGGHGESGVGRKNWTIPLFGQDVVAVLKALNVHDAVLIGHSMGSSVIVEVAKAEPNRVIAVLPVDGIFDVSSKMTKKERDHFLGPMRKNFNKACPEFVRNELFNKWTDPAFADRITKEMCAAKPEIAISAMYNLISYEEAVGASLKKISAGIRLINADNWATNLDAARKHNKGIELVVMPRLSHFLMMENPEEFNRVMEMAVRDLTEKK